MGAVENHPHSAKGDKMITEGVMAQPRICDHCRNPKSPVTPENGGLIQKWVGGQKRIVAYVHKSCKADWAKNHGGTTFDALPWPRLEKRIRCGKCGRVFEAVGSQGSETQERAEGIRCPYDGCGEPTEVKWPKNQPFFVREVATEM